MPTFAELVELDLEQQNQPPQPRRGLYEALIGSPEPLYEDAQVSPERYRPEDVALLTAMMQGRKLDELTAAEKQQLDRAVLDFEAAAAKAKAPKTSPTRRQNKEKEEPPVLVRPGVDAPETALPPFWWV